MNRIGIRYRIIASILALVFLFSNSYVPEAFAAKKNKEVTTESNDSNNSNSGNSNSSNSNSNSSNKGKLLTKDNWVKKVKSNQKTDIIIKYKNEEKKNDSVNKVKSKLKMGKMKLKRHFKEQKISVYEIGTDDDLNEVIEKLNEDSNIIYAQPNYPLNISAVPTDNKFNNQWALYNNGQVINNKAGRENVDINVMNAWNLTQGDDSVIVGILDTGIYINHNDLRSAIYQNDYEIAGNGIDDDNNGYIDDINGWDFYNDDANVFDAASTDTHGTNVAGIIAASANNGGVVGVAPLVKLLPLKFINGKIGYTSDAIEAIEYAKSMGVEVINCSFGGSDNNQALKDAMKESGILFICSAGNSGADTKDKPVYPAAFDIDNIISVAAIDSKGIVPTYSSYGDDVDVAAPGSDILSTDPGNQYNYYTGTSMAAAFVSGVAALTKSYLPDVTATSIKRRIMLSVVKCKALRDKVSTGGRVDAFAVLSGTIQPDDNYTGPGNDSNVLPTDGDTEEGTWQTLDAKASNVERFHYGEGGINPSSGNYSVSCTDMSVPAPGFQIEINRTYNSKNEKQTLLGRGWTFGFEGSIAYLYNYVEINLPNGSSYVFNNINGTYVAEGARGVSFVQNVNGVDILTTQDQYKYGFDFYSHKMIYMEDKNGNRITLSYQSNYLNSITDAVGRIYNLTYNDRKLLSSVTDPSGRKVIYEYDDRNLLTKITDPQGGTLRYEYDSSQFLTNLIDQNNQVFQQLVYGHIYAESKVVQSTDANGETWYNTYDMKNHKMSMTNREERTWTYYFDSAMYTTRVLDPEGKSTYTEYDYQDVSTYYGDVKATIDRNGNRTEYEFDERGNVTKILKPDGGVTIKRYDSYNNVIEESFFNVEKNIAEKRTFYLYDTNSSKLLMIVQPLNGTDDYNYGDTPNPNQYALTRYYYYTKDEARVKFACNVAGLLQTEVDPEGNSTTYEYNQYGDIKSIKDTATNTTTYTYDNIGQKLSETTAKGNTTRWNYDKNGLVIREIHPDSGTKRTVYYATGQIKMEVNPKQYESGKDNATTNFYTGTVGTEYTYYVNSKIKTKKDAEGIYTWYTYDVHGNLQTKERYNESTYRYEYDNMDRLKKTYFQESYGSPWLIINETSYSSLNNGNTQTSETVYMDDTTKYTTTTIKDFANRTIEVWNADGTKEKTIYNLDGTVNQQIAKNGAITYYEYDAFGQIKNILAPMSVVDGYTKYSWIRYFYNKVGDIIEERKGKNLITLDEAKTESYINQNYYSKYNTYYQGLLKQKTDSEGRKTEYEYDKENRISKETKWVSTTDTQITLTEYNYIGKPTKITHKVRTGDIIGNDFYNNNRKDIFVEYQYDKNGNIEWQKDEFGNFTLYYYDKLDRNIVTEYDFVNIIFATFKTYSWDGQIASETDARGNTSIYTYDAYGNQNYIKDALGNTTWKGYDRIGRNTIIVSPKNYRPNVPISELERTEFVYDSMNRVLAQNEVYKAILSDGYSTRTGDLKRVNTKLYQYDSLGNIISTTVPKDNTSKASYNLAGLQESVSDAQTIEDGYDFTVMYTYNGLGQKINEVYQGVNYAFTYDGTGNLLSTSINGVPKKTITYDLLGRAISIKDGREYITQQRWNAFGQLSEVTLPGDSTISSNTIIYQYDVKGNLKYTKDTIGVVTTYYYDQFNRVLSQKVTNKEGTQSITTSKTYDANGNVTSETDGRQKTTYYTYDKLNQRITSTNALGQITIYNYDANGKLVYEQNQFGNSTQYVYDGINRLIETRKNHGITNYIMHLYENVLGRKPSASEVEGWATLYNTGKITCGELASSFINSNEYKQKNVSDTEYIKMLYRVLLNYNANESGINYWQQSINDLSREIVLSIFVNYIEDFHIVTSRYNLNQYTTIQINLYNDADVQTHSYDALGNKTEFRYDKNLRQIATIDGKENSTSMTYDTRGNISSKTDARGNITNYEYDGENRLKSVIDALGNITSYEYDNNDNVITQKDGNGNATTYQYNAVNKLITKKDPSVNGKEGLIESYYYYTNGLLQTKIDRNKITTTYTYDDWGRLTCENAGGVEQGYTYDNNGNMLTMSNSSGVTTRTYDALNRTETKTVTGFGVSTYLYDISTGIAGGYIEQTTDPKGNVTKKTYDKEGRLIKVAVGEEITSYEYYRNGRQFKVTYPNQTTESYYYDANNHVTKLINTKSDSTVLSSYVYDYDAAGNQISKTEAKGTTT